MDFTDEEEVVIFSAVNGLKELYEKSLARGDTFLEDDKKNIIALCESILSKL